jgi:hypothetical protein
MPGPQGSTADQVHAPTPVPELCALLLLLEALVVVALDPPLPPCPLDVAPLPPPVPLVVAPPVVALAPPLPVAPLAAVVSPPLPQPQIAASAAAGARRTIEDHRMKSSVARMM